ncbi:MAG TPA: 3-phosphoshikimate 1-carboxyvinyltransferase [Terriglobales bacterium]|nr:3-phosphoshikimate 1-carboxyvinyltransferase [Terriglobales bacterium]
MTNPSRSIIIRPARNVVGSLRLPGDKSISHRYAMLAAIAEGPTRLENYSTGMDCASTLGCLRGLGVEWRRTERVVEIHGRGARLQAPTEQLDCGNSGSTMRMLSGILAGQEFSSELVGDESLSRRPMGRIMKPLSSMGARISAAAGDRPPLRISGGSLRAIDYRMPVASAQVKSSILFAGFFAEGETRVEEPLRTRDHGELALRAFGAEVKVAGNEARIAGGQKLHGIEASVPGDISSAAFFLCAAALFPGSELTISGLLMNPTRARLLDILVQMGVRISVTQLEEHHGELVGTVHVAGDKLKGASIAGADTAALIDELPVLAAIAPYSGEGIEIRDARELRVKESDRIAVVAANLRAMGANVEEREDGMKIPGGQSLHGAEVDSQGDHRIAMAFSIAALRAQGETRILNAGAADVSYPGFYATLEQVIQR